MPAAISDALTWRIVEKRLYKFTGLWGKTFREISDELLVPLATVFDVVSRSTERASFQTWQGARCSLPANATLDTRQRWFLVDLIIEVPADTLLEEIAALFFAAEGIELDVPFMSKTMLSMGFTHKTVRCRCAPRATRPHVPRVSFLDVFPCVAALDSRPHARRREGPREEAALEHDLQPGADGLGRRVWLL